MRFTQVYRVRARSTPNKLADACVVLTNTRRTAAAQGIPSSCCATDSNVRFPATWTAEAPHFGGEC
uniref:Uncharacterized protein n=1 Tax=Oryza sativa subsp. japonica TaxID=39947 RepID=Q6YV34_ORYSJ|nr:hypothetical protein [Oryza sativa Japonica Group]BAD08095.1 hypothetical protein [Oryza sativa Japonica Group]